jgi:single-stranded DNA-specific DHH superfamily exonuclease
LKYKLRSKYSKDPQRALEEILYDRGVRDIKNFINPSFKCELNPYDLENIEAAASKLLEHLHADHNILIVIDADCDGFTSSSILWLYIKNIFPNAKLNFTIHEHK